MDPLYFPIFLLDREPIVPRAGDIFFFRIFGNKIILEWQRPGKSSNSCTISFIKDLGSQKHHRYFIAKHDVKTLIKFLNSALQYSVETSRKHAYDTDKSSFLEFRLTEKNDFGECVLQCFKVVARKKKIILITVPEHRKI
ncbi:hypothetical protein KKC60_01625 [Patescibacteria group bacterium]|nr:hypothetical protein [Patescibacteria group bacterium]